MDLQSELLQMVWQYLLAEINLDEFQEWFVPYWAFFAVLAPESKVYELAGNIELGLAELVNGDINEEEFRAMIREVVDTEPVMFTYYGDPPPMRLAASSTNKSTSLIIGTAEYRLIAV